MSGAVASLLLFLAVAMPTPEEVQRALSHVLDKERYQTTLPDATGSDPPAADQPPESRRGPREGRRGSSAVSARIPDAVAGIARALLYVVGAVFLLLVAIWFFREWRARPGRPPGPPPIAHGTVSPPTEAPLPDAERLFREGRIAEAIHALLLACIGELPALPPATTSREMVAAGRFPAPARAALQDLVAKVELSRFGGRTLHEADYRAGLESRARFLAARQR